MPRLLPLLLTLSLTTLSGCIAVGGTSVQKSPTLGEQLCDLKTALDKGAINAAEYDLAKHRLLTGGK